MDLVDSWRLVNMLINAVLYGTLAATCCEMLRNIFEWSPSTATDQLEVIKRLSWEPICNDLFWYLSISRNMPLDVWPFNNYILQRQPIGPSVDCSTWWPQCPSKAEVCGQSPGDACARDCHQGQGPWAAMGRQGPGIPGLIGFQRSWVSRSLSSSVFRNTHTNTKKQLSTAGMIPEVSKK
jgi:hypothetical protein